MENAVTGGESRQTMTQQKASRGPGPDGQYVAVVNGAEVAFKDVVPKGEHILEKAGFLPAGDYVLIQLLGHSTRSVGLDEAVDLSLEGAETFRSFKSDRIFRFTLNGHGFEWGDDKITEQDLRLIGNVRPDEVLVLERDGQDVDIGPGDVLDLGRSGTEHLRSEKRLITVFFDNMPREIPRGTYTTDQLKHLFGVQPGYVLEFINEEGRLTPLKPGAKLRVKEGMKFFEQVPCGSSS